MRDIQLSDKQSLLFEEIINKDNEVENLCNEYQLLKENYNQISNELKQRILQEKEELKNSEISKVDKDRHLQEISKSYNVERTKLVYDMDRKFDSIENHYKELSILKKQKDTRIVLKLIKNEIREIKKNLKEELKQIKGNEQDKIKRNETITEIKTKYKPRIEEKITERNKLKKGLDKITLFSVLTISLVVLIAGALCLDYLVYIPKTNGGIKYDFGLKESIFAVSVSGILIILLGVVAYRLLNDSEKVLMAERNQNSFKTGVGIGFFTNFFDTIGIGSFAPTIVLLRLFKGYKEDKRIPGILNAGHTIPVILQAIIFVIAIKVDIYTLITLTATTVVGGYIGASLANKVNGKSIKLIMGIVLFVTAIFMILSHPMIGVFEGVGKAKGLSFDGWKIYVTAFIFLILGLLISFGIGLYAPAMAVITLMGMDVTVAFPIMMTSTAFVMPVGTLKFMKDKNYEPKVSVGITTGGIFGVFTAFVIVFVGFSGHTQFVNYLLFLVIAVIFYASISILYDFFKGKKIE